MSQPSLSVPGSPQELAEVLAAANAAGQAVAPRGGGSKSDWGNPPIRTDLILSTAQLNRVIEHAWADMTVTVEAGCTVASLQATLAEHGQRLAIDPLWPERATIGGILAANDSGALRLRYGALRDLIIGITVALPDGTIALSGGKVVKNVAGYDLPKLMTGALGTLGVITQAVFRLHPLPRLSRTLSITPSNPEDAQRLILAIQNSQLAHSALQCRGNHASVELDILLEGTEAGIDAQQAAIHSLAPVRENDPDVWSARQQLWPVEEGEAIVKFSVLPSQIADTVAQLKASRCVVQATGIGHAKLKNDVAPLRQELESKGGSLVLLTPSKLDAWGSAGDSLPLLRAVKRQFDPNNILNPGRFVGGI
ncbi:MAG: FAD-binding oxidoreductase [Acidobacteriota bacterium]